VASKIIKAIAVPRICSAPVDAGRPADLIVHDPNLSQHPTDEITIAQVNSMIIDEAAVVERESG